MFLLLFGAMVKLFGAAGAMVKLFGAAGAMVKFQGVQNLKTWNN